MIALAWMVAELLSDAFGLVVLLLRSAAAIRVENLVLRKQFAQYMERGIKPRRVDPGLAAHSRQVHAEKTTRSAPW